MQVPLIIIVKLVANKNYINIYGIYLNLKYAFAKANQTIFKHGTSLLFYVENR